jgi:hypothetical protein
LAELHTAVAALGSANESPKGGEAPHGFVDALIGSGYLVLRVHQSIARDGQKNGLPRPMPIVVGSNNFGPFYVNSVYMIDRVADHQVSTDRILNAEADGRKSAHDADTQEMVDGLLRRRQAILSWDPRINPDKRANFIAHAEAREIGLLGTLGVKLVQKTWEMSEYDFADLVKDVRRVRELGPADRSPLRPTPPRRAGVLGFGRKRR